MITYIEDKSPKYPPRTFANAMRADMTIAFAASLDTPGERLTKVAAEKQGKFYLPIDILGGGIQSSVNYALLAAGFIKYNNIKSINIAGNSVKTLVKYHITQDQCDQYVNAFIGMLLTEGIKLDFICSGGQSGADEAGIKSSVNHFIPAICHCPQGWPYLNADGQTIRNEFLFKNRFEK